MAQSDKRAVIEALRKGDAVKTRDGRTGEFDGISWDPAQQAVPQDAVVYVLLPPSTFSTDRTPLRTPFPPDDVSVRSPKVILERAERERPKRAA